jgi:hypothetical protein
LTEKSQNFPLRDSETRNELIARKKLAYQKMSFLLFIRGQAGQKTEKNHQQIRYQIFRENFEIHFLADEKIGSI